MGVAEEENKGGGGGKDGEIFSEKWMSQCYSSLVYPNASCVKVLDQVSKALARHVSQPLGSEFKQQALFLLLGSEFTEQHFPYHKYNPKKLEPPLAPRQKEKYLKEAREFLDKCLDKAVKDCGYPEDPTHYEGDDELGRFLKEVRATFNEGLKRHTAVLMFEEQTDKQRQEEQRARRMSQTSTAATDGEEEGSEEGEGPGQDGIITPADVAGQAVLAVLGHDPHKRDGFAKTLRERHLALSTTLRAHFWTAPLQAKEALRVKLKTGQDPAKEIRNNFDKTLAKEIKRQKLSRAIRSNSWKLIDNHVIETYDHTTTLRSLDTDEHMIQTARALNILNVHTKGSYSPTNIFILMPLQMVLRQRLGEEDEAHVMRLAVQLDLVKRYCQLSIKEVFTLADQVVEWVSTDDSEYLDHLNNCLNTQSSRINVRDFPPEVLLKDTKGSLKLHEELMQNGMSPKHEKLFTDPAIYIRKWIAQVFVGVLSIESTLWAWDQLFLDGWSHNTVRRLAVAVLMLVKPWMMRANMYSGARKVLIKEPGKLYLSDLRRCLGHLESGGDLTDLPPNKNYVTPKPTIQIEDENGKRRHQTDAAKEARPRGAGAGSDRGNAPSSKAKVSAMLPLDLDPHFNIDLFLDSDDDDDEPLALPEPPPDTESEPEPSAPASPSHTRTPTPTPPPPPPEHLAWVPYDQNRTQPLLPSPTRSTEPFDFYIDTVRFLPDFVTHCKVTARVVNMYASRDERMPDVITLPILESSARCPTYKCKLPLNQDRVILNTNMVIVIRVYGYQKHHRNTAVVGSCLVNVFDGSRSPPSLCVGGVQRRLRHGLPNPSHGLENLDSDDMDENEPVLALSVCYRLLPASQDHVPAPAYESGYYESEECRPNPTERRLFRHYIIHKDYMSSTVESSVQSAQRLLGRREATEHKDLERFTEETLDWRTQQRKTQKPPPHLDYSRYVTYEKKMGAKINVLSLFSLPEPLEGYYCQVYCRVVSRDGSTISDPFVTRKVDFLSYQRSPQWLDDTVTIHPDYSEGAILLVQIFGLKPNYWPGDGKRPGKVEGRDIKPLAWTFTQLFDNECAESGIHWLPLLGGRPNSPLSALTTTTPSKLLSKNMDTRRPPGSASLEVRVLDGHLDSLDMGEHRVEDMVTASGRTDLYARAQLATYTRTLDDFYLENLSEREKQRGPSRIDKERTFFEKQVNTTFFKELNDLLKKNGDPVVTRTK